VPDLSLPRTHVSARLIEVIFRNRFDLIETLPHGSLQAVD